VSLDLHFAIPLVFPVRKSYFYSNTSFCWKEGRKKEGRKEGRRKEGRVKKGGRNERRVKKGGRKEE
jgi:hypothetical protein